MTKERLSALQEIRNQANDLWLKLLTDHHDEPSSLNFIEWDDRRDYRSAMRNLADDITQLIHDELELNR